MVRILTCAATHFAPRLLPCEPYHSIVVFNQSIIQSVNLQTVQNLIVGGGVIGLSLAWELAQRGRQVSVLDAQAMGRGASWAGAGILPASARQAAVDPYEQLKSLSHTAHPEWAQRLTAATGVDTGFRRCGGIYLASTRAEAATLAAHQSWWDTHGIAYEAWDLAQLQQHEPRLFAALHDQSLIHGLRGIWFLPDEYQLRNPWHLQALAMACRQCGVELVEQAAVQRIECTGLDRIRVVTVERTWQAHQVCLCSGAWARHTLSQLGFDTGIMPIRGQMVLYRGEQQLLNSIINEGHRYLVARHDGRLLAGSVEEEAGYVVETTEPGIGSIRNWAESIMPALKQLPLERTWAGLRPGSFDGLPYLGRVPGVDNLFVAAGHFRSGLHLSCGTAIVMANAMLGLPNSIDLTPFRVGRG